MSYGPLSTNPFTVVIGSQEVYPLGVDMTAELPSGGSVSSPTVTLTDLNTGKTITLSNPPSVAGNVVTQTIEGLTTNHLYQLLIVYSAGSGVTLQSVTQIQCLA